MAGHLKRRTYTCKYGTKREVWRARYPDPERGDTHQIERSFGTKREGEDWLDEMNHRSKSGAYIDPRRAERLLAEVADAWRETWTDLEPKTRAGYDHILRKHIIGTAGRSGPFRTCSRRRCGYGHDPAVRQ